MVVGLGLDVASVERLDRALQRFGKRLWERILAPREREQLAGRGDRAAALAGRFAAKEAAFKALGGPSDVGWHDVEIRRVARGAPELHLLRAALPHARRLGVQRVLVTISHDAGIAAAVVVLDAAAGGKGTSP